MADVDPDRFGQIAGNLLDNALRYTPEGGVVTVRLSRRESVIVLDVVDTGPGIDAEDLPHVFERLYVAQRYRPVRPAGRTSGGMPKARQPTTSTSSSSVTLFGATSSRSETR